MWDFIKENSELIVATTAGFIGLGKVWQKTAHSEQRIEKLENADSMTVSSCRERQDSCHQVQIVQHVGLKEDIEELRASLRDMKKCNDLQHNNLLERGDNQHKEIMGHLLKGNW